MNIEIPDEELNTIMQEATRAVVRDVAACHSVTMHIRQSVEARIKGVADAMVLEALQNAPAIKAQIVAEVEARLRKQVVAAMKAAAQV